MEEEGAGEPPRTRARHIKKRSLKNKALSVSFDEKDLRDYVTGFHKRKKKRRKEAQKQIEVVQRRKQIEVVQRRKRIEARKKRKLEREFVQYGGASEHTNAAPEEEGDDPEKDEETMLVPSIAGTTMYDSGQLKVTVTTSEISREEERPSEIPVAATLGTIKGGDVNKHQKVPVHKKPFKRVAKQKSRRKQQNKRDKRKGKKNNNTR